VIAAAVFAGLTRWQTD